MKLLPFRAAPGVCLDGCHHANPPCIFLTGASDGKSLGNRPLETAQRLVANGFAKPSYGRKGHLKAIWLRREDGTSPVQSSMRAGTRYSFHETLEHGRCWKLRRLQMKDEDGVEFSTEPLFFTVLNECMVR